MTKPVWNTTASNLGVIKEGQYYRFNLSATNTPAYKIVSGKLPTGLELNESGRIHGIPKSTSNSSDSKYRFTIRATNDSGIKDKSFSISISRQDRLEWVTDSALTNIFDLNYINTRIEVNDSDNVTFDLISGSLPQGTKLTSAGVITGFVDPLPTGTTSRTSTFTIRASDGQTSIIRTFTLLVAMFGRNSPIFKHTTNNIGTFVHDNKFSFKVDAIDFNSANHDDSTITYTITTGSLPDGLTIDSNTGWIHGQLPFLTVDSKTYPFTVTATRSSRTASFNFTMTLLFSTNSIITWKSPENLGTIIAGTISTLNVEAQTQDNAKLIYELKSGSVLPPGMVLNANGELTGRPSFQTFQLDGGRTSFDINFDRKYDFTVNVRNIARTLTSEKSFSLIVEGVENNAPKEDWYIDLFGNESERRIWEDVVYNRQDIPDQFLYRNSDIHFGRQNRARILFVPGLPAETIDNYFRYVFKNHYSIDIRFGDFKYAKATNNNGDYIYDVVYVEIIDKFDPKGDDIILEYTIDEFKNELTIDQDSNINNSNINAGTKTINKLFPASLKRMKARLEQILSEPIDISTLPDWMSTVQDDGSVIGYIPVCPIAYVKPGFGKRVLHYLNTNPNIKLHEIDFTVDRYVIDQYFSKNYDTTTKTWNDTADEPRDNLLDGNKYLKFPREDITDTP